MITKMELIISFENEPYNVQNPLLLKEAICERLIGLEIKKDNSHTITIQDAALSGDGGGITIIPVTRH